MNSIEPAMPGVSLLRLEAPEIAHLAQPGQFLMVRCQDGLSLRRPLSVHRVTEAGQVDLLVAAVGRGSRWLSQRQPGELLDIIGPLGKGFSREFDCEHLLLVAGGMGVAPLIFLAQRALAAQRSVTLLLGVATEAAIYPWRWLSPEIRLVVATEDGSLARKGLVTDFLPEFLPWADQVFACGPLPMYRAMQGSLSHFPGSVQVSLEAWMGCGLGACYACTAMTRQGPKQVCRDGPVFEFREVLWKSMRG